MTERIVLGIFLWLLFFVALWCFVAWVTSRVGGWHQLAREYGVSRAFEGKVWAMQSISMRHRVHYRASAMVGANSKGLSFSVLPLFALGHPPLFIPWENITATPQHGLLMNVMRLEFKEVEGVYMILPQRLFLALQEYSGRLEKTQRLDF